MLSAQNHQFGGVSSTLIVYFYGMTAREGRLNCCLASRVYVSHTSGAVWSSADTPAVTTPTHPHARALIRTQRGEGTQNHQAGVGWDGMAARRINKFILTGGAWSKERHTVCRLRGRAGKRKKKKTKKELPSRHMSKPITAEHRLLFPHPKSPPPPLFILWR